MSNEGLFQLRISTNHQFSHFGGVKLTYGTYAYGTWYLCVSVWISQFSHADASLKSDEQQFVLISRQLIDVTNASVRLNVSYQLSSLGIASGKMLRKTWHFNFVHIQLICLSFVDIINMHNKLNICSASAWLSLIVTIPLAVPICDVVYAATVVQSRRCRHDIRLYKLHCVVVTLQFDWM